MKPPARIAVLTLGAFLAACAASYAGSDREALGFLSFPIFLFGAMGSIFLAVAAVVLSGLTYMDPNDL